MDFSLLQLNKTRESLLLKYNTTEETLNSLSTIIDDLTAHIPPLEASPQHSGTQEDGTIQIPTLDIDTNEESKQEDDNSQYSARMEAFLSTHRDSESWRLEAFCEDENINPTARQLSRGEITFLSQQLAIGKLRIRSASEKVASLFGQLFAEPLENGEYEEFPIRSDLPPTFETPELFGVSLMYRGGPTIKRLVWNSAIYPEGVDAEKRVWSLKRQVILSMIRGLSEK